MARRSILERMVANDPLNILAANSLQKMDGNDYMINALKINSEINSLPTESLNLTDDELSIMDPGKIKPEKITPAVDPTSMGFTTGDIVGTVGTVVGAVSQMANTIANARATKRNENYYQGFNQKALAANREAQDKVGYSRDVAKRVLDRELGLMKNTARKRMRGLSSGLGTLRAMDVAGTVAGNEATIQANNSVEQNYYQQLLPLMNQQIQLLSDADKMEMAGETARDEADRQDLDNFYTQFGKNMATATQNMQKLGSDMNQAKSRNMFLKILPQSNANNVGITAEGQMYTRQGKPIATTETTKSGTTIVPEPAYFFPGMGDALGATLDSSLDAATKRYRKSLLPTY